MITWPGDQLLLLENNKHLTLVSLSLILHHSFVQCICDFLKNFHTFLEILYEDQSQEYINWKLNVLS